MVANPEGTPRGLEITTRSGRGNFCPAEAEDDATRQDGQVIYLSGCTEGTATVELRRESDSTVLRTYTFEVTGSPADLIVESVSVNDSTPDAGQSFALSAIVRNQGTGQSAATTLQYYRSSNATISTRDTEVGTDAVGALAASATSAEWILLTAPSSGGTWYYGACVVSAGGESAGNNCSAAVRVDVASDRDALVALYQATDGPNWINSTNWLSDQPLGAWHGVTAHNGEVTRLDLGGNGLSGRIPSELGQLSNLEVLYLSINGLSGPIPSELGQLSNLKYLGLNINELSGPIPPELGKLSNLKHLGLGSNQLSGPVPSELGQLSNLERLNLGLNRLSGIIPSNLTNLTELEWVDFRYTHLRAPDADFLRWLRGIDEVNRGGGSGAMM